MKQSEVYFPDYRFYRSYLHMKRMDRRWLRHINNYVPPFYEAYIEWFKEYSPHSLGVYKNG